MAGRILGLDYGEKRIGLAISDPLGLTAQPLGFVNNHEALNKISEIIKEYQVEKIVLGLPRNMNGTYGEAAEKVGQFAEKLKKVVNLEIDFVDERLTTKEAEKFLIEADVSRSKRKQVIDQSAAIFILTTYLEKARNKT